MELLNVHSQTAKARAGRRSPFLLLETVGQYETYLVENQKAREERLSAIAHRGNQCLQNAERLRRLAKSVGRAGWGTKAETELARREALSLRAEADRQKSVGKAFRRAAWSMRLRSWVLPEPFTPGANVPPKTLWSCTSDAHFRSCLWEEQKIASEGRPVRSWNTKGANNEHWNYRRQLVVYQDRVFLVIRARRKDASPHSPWELSSVTDSPERMTEQELRTIAGSLLDERAS